MRLGGWEEKATGEEIEGGAESRCEAVGREAGRRGEGGRSKVKTVIVGARETQTMNSSN